MDKVRIVRYTSECDVTLVSGELDREEAMKLLAAMPQRELDKHDLVYAEGGRFASWVLP